MVGEHGGNVDVDEGVVRGSDDDEVGLDRDGFVVSDVRLTSVHNFRDVAGPGYALRPSGSMARGLVYRSTTLAVGDDDLAVLEKLGVSTVVDLRTGAEIDKQPDVVPAGAEYLPIDVLGGHTSAGLAWPQGHELTARVHRRAAVQPSGTSGEPMRGDLCDRFDRHVAGVGSQR